MATSLDSLTNNLVKGGHQMAGVEDYSEAHRAVSSAQYELLTRKRVYLYEYMTSWDKFDETIESPSQGSVL